MEQQVHFSEQQIFSPKRIWSIAVLVIVALIGWLLYIVFKNDANNWYLPVIGIVITIAYILFLRKATLEVNIQGPKISFKFSPFHNQTVTYSASDMTAINMVKYDALQEFGGYGLRTSTKGNGKAYICNGTIGLKIQLKDGSFVLIGTQKVDELTAVIDSYRNQYL